jgi:hypothetical protein
MNSAPSQKNVAQSLEIIAKYVSADPAGTPAQFVMELAHQWKGRGGLVAGKPRHSDRYLDALLRRNGTPIRSLTPKLGGRTQIKAGDAEELVRLFLYHWEYDGDPHETGPQATRHYKPLLTPQQIEEACAFLADRIAEVGPESRGAAEEPAARTAPGRDIFDLVVAEFKEAAVFFQIGAGRSLLVPREDEVLLGFRDIMTRLWEVDSADDRERILIWALDLGRQDFEDLESRTRFMNVEALVSRFKAMKRFKDNRAAERWNWLQSRSVVVLHDTRSFRPATARLPAFDSNHVLFSAIPPAWAESQEFQILYGTERLRDTNYSIFLKSALRTESGNTHPRPYQLHFFGHARLGDPVSQVRTLALPAPGRSYVEALGTVCQAAARALGARNIPQQFIVDGMKVEADDAIEKLQHHGFHLFRIDDFITF